MSTAMSPAGPLPAPSDDLIPLGYLIKQAQQALRAAVEAALRPHDLALAQVAVLVQLRQSPGLSNAELARASYMAPQSMVELVTGLEQAGLVVRHLHPAGGRVLQAELTPAGADRQQACHAAMIEVETRLLADLSLDERQQFRSLLKRCLASIRAA